MDLSDTQIQAKKKNEKKATTTRYHHASKRLYPQTTDIKEKEIDNFPEKQFTKL